LQARALGRRARQHVAHTDGCGPAERHEVTLVIGVTELGAQHSVVAENAARLDGSALARCIVLSLKGLHTQLLRAAVDPIGAIGREAARDQLLDHAPFDRRARGTASAETRAHLLDRSRVGLTVRTLTSLRGRPRTLAGRLDLRRELDDARFQCHAVFDFGRERVLEGREPRGGRAAIGSGPHHGHRATGRDRPGLRTRLQPKCDRESCG
jgi:hypothetical protein